MSRNQLGAYTDAQIEGLASLANKIKSSGAISILQLTHSGGKSTQVLTGGQLQAPSAIDVPVKDKQMEVPTAMTVAQIESWKKSFVSQQDARSKQVLTESSFIRLTDTGSINGCLLSQINERILTEALSKTECVCLRKSFEELEEVSRPSPFSAHPRPRFFAKRTQHGGHEMGQ